jgi:glycosyltransferase involved in cell wall biosynthesis
MKRSGKKFTLLIPTRERCDTLRWTLESCVHQDYDNLEILVSDNCSQDETRDVVESFRDKRIRYVNTGRRISMAGNFEFALSQINLNEEGYVTSIGDDDAMLPGAIKEINALLGKTNTEIISWTKSEYTWPNMVNEKFRDMLIVPLSNKLTLLKCEEVIAEIIRHYSPSSYFRLPSIYWSFVSHKAIREVTKVTGRFFQSITPDVYSGFALAFANNNYYFSNRPYSMNGVSGHSNGASQLSIDKNDKATNLFMSEQEVSFHEKLVYTPSTPILIAEAFLQAREKIPHPQNFRFEIKEVLKSAVEQAQAKMGPRQRQIVFDSVQKIAQLHGIDTYSAKLIANNSFSLDDNPWTIGYNPVKKELRLSTKDLGITNVFEAANLCQNLIMLNQVGYLSLTKLKSAIEFSARSIKRGLDRKLGPIAGHLPK